MIWMRTDYSVLVEGIVIIIARPSTLELKKGIDILGKTDQ
jgi:hypothetical protein